MESLLLLKAKKDNFWNHGNRCWNLFRKKDKWLKLIYSEKYESKERYNHIVVVNAYSTSRNSSRFEMEISVCELKKGAILCAPFPLFILELINCIDSKLRHTSFPSFPALQTTAHP